MDPPPLNLVPRPVRADCIISWLRVWSLRLAKGSAEQVFSKVPGRAVGAAHDAPRPQFLAYLGMEVEQFSYGQVFKLVQFFIRPFNDIVLSIRCPKVDSALGQSRRD